MNEILIYDNRCQLDVDIYNRIRLGLIVFAISALTLHVWISDVNAIFPFDQFMTPKMDESKNKSPEDPFKSELPGEHELPDEHGELFPDDGLNN